MSRKSGDLLWQFSQAFRVKVPVNRDESSYRIKFCDNPRPSMGAGDFVLRTEYSRAILALTAIGKDPADVGGYNLLAKLGDFEKVLSQGINGPLFALLALDAGNYAIPECAGAKVQTTRELLLGAIIDQQLPDGGFSLGGKEGDADITAMVLQALAPYQEHAAVKTAIDKALVCLSRLQDSDGGYKGFGGAATLESDVQVLIALAALDINPAVDSRFIKNGKTIIDYLLEYALPGGGFKHCTALSIATVTP